VNRCVGREPRLVGHVCYDPQTPVLIPWGMWTPGPF